VVEFDGVAALCGVDLECREGEWLAVLGATGAGKSTLLQCSNRVVPELRPGRVRGEIEVLGRSVEGLRVGELAGHVAFVFQDFEAQLFSTSVREEILFGLEQLALPPKEMDARVEQALEAVGLVGFERRDPTSLSGGEKQRLAIASALAQGPGLFALDEPSTDLDPAGREEIFSVLERLRGAGTALLVAEHDTEAMRVAERVAVLDRGRVALAGEPREVLVRATALARLGVRPPELAAVCEPLGLDPWPLEPEVVAARLVASGRVVRAVACSRGETAPGPPCLELAGVSYRYPGAFRDAVSGIELRFGQGEFVAVVGPNGSGKSTLARLAIGLLAPDRGEVLYRGQPVRSLGAAERACAVGYVFQDPDEQIFASTVAEEVAFGPERIGLPPSEAKRRVAEALEMLGLEELSERDPFLLGKGQRQKVAVASILALAPQVLILDEPTTGLDFRESCDLLDRLEELNRRGRTIVVLTHVPWVVSRCARRVVAMRQGRVVFDGPVRAFLADPQACEAARFVPGPLVRLGARFGAIPRSPEEFLSWVVPA
jgi:energy-coupling factor transport system ATP-binding protein